MGNKGTKEKEEEGRPERQQIFQSQSQHAGGDGPGRRWGVRWRRRRGPQIQGSGPRGENGARCTAVPGRSASPDEVEEKENQKRDLYPTTPGPAVPGHHGRVSGRRGPPASDVESGTQTTPPGGYEISSSGEPCKAACQVSRDIKSRTADEVGPGPTDKGPYGMCEDNLARSPAPTKDPHGLPGHFPSTTVSWQADQMLQLPATRAPTERLQKQGAMWYLQPGTQHQGVPGEEGQRGRYLQEVCQLWGTTHSSIRPVSPHAGEEGQGETDQTCRPSPPSHTSTTQPPGDATTTNKPPGDSVTVSTPSCGPGPSYGNHGDNVPDSHAATKHTGARPTDPATGQPMQVHGGHDVTPVVKNEADLHSPVLQLSSNQDSYSETETAQFSCDHDSCDSYSEAGPERGSTGNTHRGRSDDSASSVGASQSTQVVRPSVCQSVGPSADTSVRSQSGRDCQVNYSKLVVSPPSTSQQSVRPSIRTSVRTSVSPALRSQSGRDCQVNYSNDDYSPPSTSQQSVRPSVRTSVRTSVNTSLRSQSGRDCQVNNSYEGSPPSTSQQSVRPSVRTSVRTTVTTSLRSQSGRDCQDNQKTEACQKATRDLKVVHWNAQGANSKLAMIQQYALQEDIDVLCIEDTRLLPKKENPSDSRLKIPGYTVHHIPASPDGHHGLVTAVHRRFYSIPVVSPCSSADFECLSVLVRTADVTLQVHNIYRIRGDMPVSNFLVPGNSIICGDFNAHHEAWGHRTDPEGEELLEAVSTTNTHVILNDGSPTHVLGGSMDVTLVSKSLANRSSWEVDPESLTSDHFGILLTIHWVQVPEDDPHRPKWVTSRADWDQYRWNMETVLEDASPPPADNLGAASEFVLHVLNAAADGAIPQVTSKPKRADQWYLNERVLRAKEEVNYCRRRYAATRSLQNRRRLASANNFLRSVTKEARQDAWVKWSSEMNNQTTVRELWGRIRQASGVPHRPPRHPDPVGKAEQLTTDFAARCDPTKLHPRIQKALSSRESKRRVRVQTAKHLPHEADRPFTIRELEQVLRGRRDSAPGDDGVLYSMIREALAELQFYILEVINASWAQSKLVDKWKQANIQPIPKPLQKDAFRPISLLAVLSKVMERMVLYRLRWAAGPLHPHLMGFLPGRGTMDAVTLVVSHLSETKRTQSSRKAAAVFLDLEKAFEMTDHLVILDCLVSVGIRGHMLSWVEDFLKNRSGRVIYQGHPAEFQTFSNGTPQGSSLSPFLFNMVIHSLLQVNMPKGVKVVAYADDLAIVAVHIRAPEQLQLAVNRVATECDELGLSISAPKTKAMSFTRDPEVPISIHGQPLEWVSNFRYLGVTLDRHLKFNRYAVTLRARIQKRLNAMVAVSGSPGGACSRVLRAWYIGAVRPVLEYGCQVLAIAGVSAVPTIEKIQNRAARIILGVPGWSCPTATIAEAGLQPLEYRFEGATVVLADKILRDVTHPLHPKMVDALPKDRTAWPFNTWTLRAADLMNEYVPTPLQSSPERPPSYPPWASPAAEIHIWKPYDAKEATEREVVREIAVEYIKELERDHPGARVYFTDGSVDPDGRSGGAFHTEGREFVFRATDGASTLQVELAAIREVVHDVAAHPVKVAIVNTDSMGSLQNLRHLVHSDNIDLLADIQEGIQSLQTRFILNWVPSHVGVPGNEKADELAKSATLRPEIDIAIPLSRAQVKARVRQKIQDKWEDRKDGAKPTIDWHNQISQLQGAKRRLMSLNREEARHIFAMRIRCPFSLGDHKYQMCPRCDMDTRCQVTHLLTECPVVAAQRNHLLQPLPASLHTADQQSLAINILNHQLTRDHLELREFLASL